MRLFIIGRILDRKKLVAYKLYDDHSKETGMYPKENVRFRVKQGIPVVGLRVTKDGSSVIGVHDSFNVSKTDLLNGEGEPIESIRRFTLLGYSGYLEATRFRLVDSSAVEIIVSKKEFEELVKQGRVNGAEFSTSIEGKINIYPQCNYREYYY